MNYERFFPGKNVGPMEGSHLTSAQMDGLLFPAVGRDEAAERHLRTCAVCAEEVAELRGSLGLLRDAVTGMARQQTILRGRRMAGSELPSVSRIRSVRGLPLAVAAGLLVAAVLVPAIPHRHGLTQTNARVVAPAASLADDEALLQEIDEQVSASVPSAMEPLANPVKMTNNSPLSSSRTKKALATTKD